MGFLFDDPLCERFATTLRECCPTWLASEQLSPTAREYVPIGHSHRPRPPTAQPVWESWPQRRVDGVAGHGDGDLVHARAGGDVEGSPARPSEGQVGDVVLRDRHPSEELAVGGDDV